MPCEEPSGNDKSQTVLQERFPYGSVKPDTGFQTRFLQLLPRLSGGAFLIKT